MVDDLLVSAAIEDVEIALRGLEELLDHEERPHEDPLRQAAARVRSAVLDEQAIVLI